jgi:K+-transporting ATPase ATPase B chain
MATKAKKISMWDPAITRRAIVDSFQKLDPRIQIKNPVMFIVEVGSLVTTVIWIQEVMGGTGSPLFTGQVALWLWFTVLFANFAEAMAEGRGKAQAATLRKTKAETTAVRIRNNAKEIVSAGELRAGDIVRVEAGHRIPGDGEVIEGIASVDESTITGESAPVIREAGGDRFGLDCRPHHVQSG